MAALRIYNTLSGGKDEFVPITPGKVGMYVCGVTVYDNCHIGHARANVVFDVIYCYLETCGYEVTYVRNYTDIDDKIINRANREGVSCQDISERFIAEFDHDMARLRLVLPTFQPKATEHIGEIIKLIENLIHKECAYQAEGDVYFCVERFDSYLKLSKRNLEEMQAGARIEVDERKRHPMDFALWKDSKPGEPSWDSPWGKGRPGWHIECSAMSMKYLGESFDIHGGGKDLIFPHHDNEIAQSEAFTGKPFVKYWIHNGFVNINAEKMSKSLGNFFTIKEVLDKYDSEVLRFFLLSTHYRSPLDFNEQSMTEAEAGLERIYKALAGIDKVVETPPADLAETSDTLQELAEKTGSFRQRFREAMDDDFNTALALGNVFDLIRSVNRLLAEKMASSAAVYALCGEVKAIFAEIGGILGIFTSEPSAYLSRIRERKTEGLQLTVEEIRLLIEERTVARKSKEFKRSDDIRDFLLDRNVILFDGLQDTTWKVK